MESKSLSKAYGLAGSKKGVLVKHIAPFVDAQKKLKKGDIIMKFDGVQIASDGTVPFRCDVPSKIGPLMYELCSQMLNVSQCWQ